MLSLHGENRKFWNRPTGLLCGPANSSHKGQSRGAFMFSLICAQIKGWVNNREAGDWRRHRAHHDVIVMYKPHRLLQQLASGQTSFQSEDFNMSDRITPALVALHCQIPDWIQNTVDRLQRTSWQRTYLHPRNDHPIKKQNIFHKIQWRACPEGSIIQAWYFRQRYIRSECMGLWHGIACQRKLGYVMKLKHSSEK